MILPLALASGCAAPIGDFCDVSQPMYFDRIDVVEWLNENDPALLRRVVTHNEMVGRCS